MADIINMAYEMIAPYAVFIALIALILCFALIIFVIIMIFQYQKLSKRMSFFMRDTRNDSMEQVLVQVIQDNRDMRDICRENTEEIAKINENLLTAYRKVGVVKYNAFPGMAGKVSASIALLNNENNGLIITAIHGQEGCYTYVKEIMNGKSINPLTKEDEDALKIALQVEL